MPLKEIPVFWWRMVIFIQLCCCSLAVSGGRAESWAYPTRFDSWTTEQGLAGNQVFAITQDAQGYLWIGTALGLSRFDGREFTNFTTDSPQFRLPHDLVLALLTDRHNRLWIGTEDGLAVHDLNTAETTVYFHDESDPGSLSNHSIRSIVEDHEGTIWVGTRSGLNRFNEERQNFTSYLPAADTPDSLPHPFIKRLAIDKHNTLYVATVGKGVSRFEREKNRFAQVDATFGDGLIRTVYIDDANRLWIGSNLPKIKIIDLDSGDSTLLSVPGDSNIREIAQDAEGNFWVATHDAGVHIFSPALALLETLIPDSRYRMALTSNSGETLYLDSGGAMWVGSFLDGLFRRNPIASSFGHFSTGGNRSNIAVISAFTDAQERLWTGGDQWLELRHPQWPFNLLASTRVSAHVHAIAQLDAGRFLLGTSRDIQLLTMPENSLSPINVAPIPQTEFAPVFDLQVQGGFAFAATGAGILQMKVADMSISKRQIGQPQQPLDINEEIFVALVGDGGRRMWMGSYYGDIFQMDTQTLAIQRLFSLRQKLDKTVFLADLMYADNKLYLSTNEGAIIYRFDDEGVAQIGKRQGLSSMVVASVARDDDMLLISTDKGINVYDEKNNRVRRILTVKDGLQDNEFMNAVVTKFANGCFLFGGVNGFNHLCRTALPAPKSLTAPILESLAVNYQPVTTFKQLKRWSKRPLTVSDALTFNHKDKQIGLTFTSIGYDNNPRLTFRYRLLGFDDDWVIADARTRTAHYTSIPPGEYTFQVEAFDTLFPEQKLQKKLGIRVLAPPWLSAWAIAAYILAIAAALWTAYFLRTRQLQRYTTQLEVSVRERTQEISQQAAKIEDQRNQIERALNDKESLFEQISHELRTPVTLLNLQIQQLAIQPLPASDSEAIHVMYRSIHRLGQMVEDIIDLSKVRASIRPAASTLPVARVAHAVVDFLRPLGRQYQVEISVEIAATLVVEAIEKEIVLMLRNLVNNAILHADCRHITLAAQLEDSTLCLSVRDDGKGIPAADQAHIFERFYRIQSRSARPGSGLGLALVKQVVENHGGHIDIHSQTGKGCEFIVRLPHAGHLEDTRMLAAHDAIAAHPPMPDADSLMVQAFDEPTPQDRDEAMLQARILVVEDEPDLCRALQSVLGESFVVDTAADGREGLDKAVNLLPDLILTDLRMPNMDGLALLKAIKSDTLTRHIPVVLLTAVDEERVKLRGYEHQLDHFLKKPFDLQELLSIIRSTLQNRLLIRQHALRQATGEDDTKSEFLRKLDELVHAQLADVSTTVESLAGDIALSRQQFYRKVCAESGLTPKEYLRSRRMERAKTLLGRGQRVEQVIGACGYRDDDAFRTHFKQRFGVTPKQYQRQLKSGGVQGTY